MAFEASTIRDQIVAPNGSVTYELEPVPCTRGLVYHRDGSGVLRLASPSIIRCGNRRSCCCRQPVADYVASFHATVQIPADGEVAPISFAVFIDGEEDPGSVMTITPAAAEEPGNIGTDVVVSVPWICRCASLSVRNIGTEPVEVLNAVLVVDFGGIR